MFTAPDPGRFAGQVVSTGHCVRFCQVAAPGLPHTSMWRQGRQVRGGAVERGTVIATFGANGRYTNLTDGSAHAAIFVSEYPAGILVWDQWVGQPVNQRNIGFHGGTRNAVNDGDAFYVVEAEIEA